jgi:hypothetical protein
MSFLLVIVLAILMLGNAIALLWVGMRLGRQGRWTYLCGLASYAAGSTVDGLGWRQPWGPVLHEPMKPRSPA